MPGEWNKAVAQYDPVGLGHTFDYVMDKIESFLLQSGWERPSWDTGALTVTLNTGASAPFGTKASTESRFFIRTDRNTQERWRFTGDAVTLHGGIVLSYDSSASVGSETGPQIVLQTFVQNAAATGVYVASSVNVVTTDAISGSGSDVRFGSIRISLDNFTVNNFLIYGGEDALYLESGSGGLNTNLGHGAIMTFGAIPEFNGTRSVAVQWTAQGLILDFRRNCKFTAVRNDRFVTNDGTDKNFTASLQPITPRGTANIYTLTSNVENFRAYYVGAIDNFLGANVGGASGSTGVDVVSAETLSSKFAASFGLINTPLDGRFRISQVAMLQHLGQIRAGVNSALSSNNVAAAVSNFTVLDFRDVLRRVFRFAVVDYTLLPFVNIVDAVTGATYRVLRIDDNGRFSQLGIEVPSTPSLVL